MKRDYSLITLIAIPQIIGLLGGWFTHKEVVVWYDNLHKPNITPPGWVFSVVWPLLYLLIGIASWLVWKKRKEHAIAFPLFIYFFQLLLNLFWSVIFFKLHFIDLALLEMYLLIIFTVFNLMVFWKVSKLATVLLVPYLVWIGFAFSLNFQIFLMNGVCSYG